MRLEWPTITVIILCYALWLIVGFWLYPISPLLTLCIMVILSALHSSLTHEAIHGHPTKNRLINEALVCFPLSLIYPYRRYRQTHLLHHRNTFITDPFEDPESYYLAWWQFKPMPYPVKQLLRVNNSMAGRLIFGPLLSALAFITSDIRKMSKPSSAIWLGWLLHLPPCAIVLYCLYLMGIPFWVYLLGVCWPALSLMSLRSFAEHRWHETPEGRTIIVEHSPLSWLFLNNNLHVVHHYHPMEPWYKLPALYKKDREKWQKRNDGYVYKNYFELWKAYGFKPKEPVVHPMLDNST
jgi:fatty acid desaturase